MAFERGKTIVNRLYKQMETREHRLWYVFLEITRRCNLSCLHCGSDCRMQPDSPLLTTDSWLKIIRYCREHFGDGLAFIITGGEPLVHPDLEEIGAAISALGMRWGLVTNGYALDEKRLLKLLAAGLSSITISLDGPAESHNRLRNKHDAFQRSTASIALSSASGIKFHDVVTCVHPGNMHQLDETAEILIRLGATNWRLFRIFPSGRAARNPELLLTHGQTWQMLDWIAGKRPHYAGLGLNLGASCEGYVPLATDRTIRDNPFFCRAGINIASILCNGTITGCSNNHHSFHEGNILRDNLATLWEKGFGRFRDRQWVQHTDCGGCEHLKDCRGGSIHLWEYGSARPKFCYMEEIHPS
ncbi:MAG: radical SAM protein [Nitrospirae bacterium]|nr:radical SAM protein [Nitrospirota bacterium]